jgi:hypothetical protein
MKTTNYSLLVLLICNGYSYAQSPKDCSRAVINKRLVPKLDSVFCVPKGYCITDIKEIDLTDDDRSDKIISWRKIKAVDGDTIFYSLYSQNSKGFYSLQRKFSNLSPLYYKNYSDDYKTGNKYLDSIKTRYVNPELIEVIFERNNIVVNLYMESTVLRKLLFTYTSKEKTWMLTQVMQWFVPPNNYGADEELDENGRRLEFDRAPEKPMRIENFDILKYIGW